MASVQSYIYTRYHLNGWNSFSGIILYLCRWGSESWKHHSDMLGPHNYGKATIVLGGQIWVVSGGASEYLSVSIWQKSIQNNFSCSDRNIQKWRVGRRAKLANDWLHWSKIGGLQLFWGSYHLWYLRAGVERASATNRLNYNMYEISRGTICHDWTSKASYYRLYVLVLSRLRVQARPDMPYIFCWGRCTLFIIYDAQSRRSLFYI